MSKLDEIAKKAEFRKLGPQVEDGNIGKWFWEEDGRWQWAHIYFGIFGPGSGSLGTCLKAPTDLLPKYVDLYQRWVTTNTKALSEVGGGAADFIVFGVHPAYIDVTGGISVKPKPDDYDKIYNLWKDLLITQIKELGAMHYWMGEIIGHALVDSGALTPEFYEFMTKIKKILDPNKIMSPEKFYLSQQY